MKKLFIFIVTVSLFIPWPAQAQELDYQCVGKGLADYMNTIIAGAGSLSRVRLLSPAFNMTSYTFDGIVNAMGVNGAKFDKLSGIAGNVYNVDNRRITSYLDEKLANKNIAGLPVYLTETGAKDVADGKTDRVLGLTALGDEIGKFKSPNNKWKVKAAALFNVFNTNSEFSGFAISDEELKKYVCGLSCATAGFNTARNFPIDQPLLDRAGIGRLNMQYAVAIATKGDLAGIVDTIKRAANKNIVTIIRVGVGTDSGGFENPQDYVNFLKQLDSQISNIPFDIYALAGPNEPDSEFWATPQCQTRQLPAKKGPLEEGFAPATIDCGATKEPNYHPLRPYPGNPCDPLIPRSIPEAPVTSEKKFNTFACGTSLTPSAVERFDPYGKNAYYENLPTDYGSAHTICDPLTPELAKNGGKIKCWRSEAFDVTLDLSKANLGILGNTQDNSLTDAQKVNEYLSWYLAGTSPSFVDFAGPLRKLLPADLQNIGRKTVAGSAKKDVHNYIAGSNLWGLDQVRIDRFSGWLGGLNEALLQKIFQNVPFSSLEDTAGEVTVSVFRDPAADQQDPNVRDSYSSRGKTTAPLKLIIQKAELAE